MMTHKKFTLLLVGTVSIFLSSCYQKEEINNPVRNTQAEMNELDNYIQSNFTDEYNIAVRYRYFDKYVTPYDRVTPPRTDLVIPMLEFIKYYWMDPYMEIDNGEAFFKRYVPTEIVLFGGYLFNSEGNRRLGFADTNSGSRITFTEVNTYDTANIAWIDLQLKTVNHEFAHIFHSQFNLPQSYENISPEGYTNSGSWFTISDEEALQRGFVSAYGSSSVYEDFCEVVSEFIVNPDFYEQFTQLETNCGTPECEALNEGKTKIRLKLNAILEHYKNKSGVDLELLREKVQSRLY